MIGRVHTVEGEGSARRTRLYRDTNNNRRTMNLRDEKARDHLRKATPAMINVRCAQGKKANVARLICRHQRPAETLFRNDRTPGRGGGTAILVRKGVKHELLPSLSVNNFETTSIKIDIQERPFVITSLYRKSSAFNYAEYRSLVEGKFPKIIERIPQVTPS
ncbi:uncharacterized protein LOC143203163 [Rhynchophorus ferrugineus]|uniref:uncharacterized protein LOC143203163 n=1 Tax=Rhynchophorus ferrugineus TaxID=354439 RepID=UPI003FCCD624